MARVGGSYESVVRGVSEQASQDRRSGQVYEQVNMISDPVRGNVRRHGSEFQSSMLLHGSQLPQFELEEFAKKATTKAYYCDGRELEVIYRKAPGLANLLNVQCYDKTQGKFLRVQASGGAVCEDILANGVASMVNIGRYMFIAGAKFTPTWSFEKALPEQTSQNSGVIWIRQGSFSRTYNVRMTLADGRTVVASYKTMPATYEGKLDTSDIKWDKDDPGKYTKEITDRTNAYNTAVTQHIAKATADIQPENIALGLAKNMSEVSGAAGFVVDSQFIYWEAGVGVVGVSVEDGGDDTYMRAVVHTVDSIEKLSPNHWGGKVIRIAPKKQSNKDAYYVKAHLKSGGVRGEVTWKETAGEVQTPTSMFGIAWASSDTLYIGESPAALNAIAPDAKCPPFKPSTVGDSISSPLPTFFGKPLSYLGVFQDRLLVATGAVVFASRPGDYFNMFRQSVLTVEDNDPVEMFALGSEDDTISWDTSFDRNHVLFGRKFQYVIPGRVMLSPRNPSIQIMSANEDAVEAEPKNSGNFVFFAKDTAKKGSLHQIQMGSTSDSSESYECSQQLDKYIRGRPNQIVCTTAPYNALVRSTGNPNGFYIYTYLDSMQGADRLFDSWSRWEWDARLGPCCCIAKWKGELLVFTVRNSPIGCFIVCDKFTFDTALSSKPHLDSNRPFVDAVKNPLWLQGELYNASDVAYNDSHDYYMLGSKTVEAGENMPWYLDEGHVEHLTIGVGFPAYLEPTSPYMRDRNDKAIVNGRLTLSKLDVTVADTGGLVAILKTADRETVAARFEGRLLNRKSNLIGGAPIADSVIPVPVFKEIREFKLRISAHSWLPLSITGIEWVGQWFSNIRRV
ncbi:putative tail tubular protein B [Aeromonas phage ZPAH7B]|uniref:Putative tail tubular protein B n=2 Tax=Aerosvirus ZPAH7 TaxID=2733366 RepID=A0A3Q9GJ82_9CAUD|nr:tail protein [Aeromonas phage ZPAH7]AZQ96392.1 putative tail tubular protein B [Aeromonas phage ZPAH7]QAX95972.1 putative tail tubular protein B [Aeromonas phage ZPAH7B]